MKYVTGIAIENFQSHERSELRFGPGLNVIVGPSDSGKSAAIRALRWALYNEPRGSDFIRQGAGTCRVHVTFNDGVEIIREAHQTKSATKHKYTVRIPGEGEKVFEGFGADLPPDVVRAHGMPQVHLDKDRGLTLNLGSQLEGPFLLSASGSDRARAIGRMLGVHVVDAAIRTATSDVRRMGQEAARVEKEIEQYDLQLAPYADLPAHEAALKRAESLLDLADQLGRRMERLEEIRRRLAERETAIGQTVGVLTSLARLPEAETALAKAELASQREKLLTRYSADWNRIGQDLGRIKAILDAAVAVVLAEERANRLDEQRERLKGLEKLAENYRSRTVEWTAAQAAVKRLESVPGADQALTRAEQLQTRLTTLATLQTALIEKSGRIEMGRSKLQEVEQDLQGALREYTRILQSLGNCPTCGSPVGPDHIEKIVADLAGGSDH